jgi:hypothetical protein
MWLFRELFRLVWMIAVTVAIAAAVGALIALVSSGSLVHDLRIDFLAFGALLVLLAGAGNRSTASARRANWGIMVGMRSKIGVLSPPVRSRPGDPTLTGSAVFVGSGLALIVLGLLV